LESSGQHKRTFYFFPGERPPKEPTLGFLEEAAVAKPEPGDRQGLAADRQGLAADRQGFQANGQGLGSDQQGRCRLLDAGWTIIPVEEAGY